MIAEFPHACHGIAMVLRTVCFSFRMRAISSRYAVAGFGARQPMQKIIARIRSAYDDPTIGKFLGLMMLFGVAVGIMSGVLNNYLYEILAIDRIGRGMVEFPREFPGLVLFVLVGLMHHFTEKRMLRTAFIVSAGGMIMLFIWGNTMIPSVLFIVLWSTGEHLVMPVRQSISLHAARKGKEGLAMGTTASVANIGQVVGHYIVPVLFIILRATGAFGGSRSEGTIGPGEGLFGYYRSAFLIAAVLMLVGVFLSYRIAGADKPVRRPRLFFRKRYWRYYVLEAFFGARKQVFFTFAPYVLIIKYGARAEFIATLYGIWSLATIFIGPLFGKLLDKVGHRVIIIVDAILLALLCLIYGFAHRVLPLGTAFVVVSIVFVVDAILFVVRLARAMYARTLSDSPEEVTAALSTGISVNHLISILIAVAGGFLWERLGMETLFSLAAVFGIGSAIFAFTLPRVRHDTD
jgi:predicted MFS family arabinose efflux permease